MCKDYTDYSTRIQWGKLLSSYQMPSCVRHTPKLQVDAKEALTNGYQRGPRWQSWWSLSWKFQWHSKKTICEWKTSRMDTCIDVLLRNISFSGFPSGSALVQFTGGCRTRQWFSVIPAIQGDASKTSSWKNHRNLEFFNMQHPFWVWKLRTCAPLVSSCWKVLTLILAVEIEEIETSIFKTQSHRFQNLGRTYLCWIHLKVYSITFDSHPWLLTSLKLVDVGCLVPLHGCVSRSPGLQKDEGHRCETCSGSERKRTGDGQGSHCSFMFLTLILAAQAFSARHSFL